MERRRRALGLKTAGPNPEQSAGKNCRESPSARESSKSTSKEKIFSRDSQKSPPSGSVTPTQKKVFSHNNVTPLKPESPCSPMQSPSPQMIFPGTLASPEIEVSWDWSCSQIPKDMLPPKSTRRRQDKKAQLPVLPTIKIPPRPRSHLQRQITEEENQQRLEFYKRLANFKPHESSSNVLYDSTNNNVEKTVLDEAKLNCTPKRPTTRSSSSSQKKYGDNSLFDDSANEFMLECSQAIEEKLKNGEIDMGPIVDIKLSQSKRIHSPEVGTVNKKTCHGRINLFPDNLKRDTHLKDKLDTNANVGSSSNQNPNSNTQHPNTSKATLNNGNIKNPSEGLNSRLKGNTGNSLNHPSNLNTLEKRPLPQNYIQSTTSNQSVKSDTKPLQSKYTEKSISSLSTTNHNRPTRDIFCEPQRFFANGKANHQSLNSGNSRPTLRYQQENNNKQANFSTRKNENIQGQHLNNIIQEKPNTSDITSLLEDDFDLELSTLDVDSLCLKSQNKQPEVKSATSSAPKVCTRQEIEAKRLAALQKLMMKKKRKN